MPESQHNAGVAGQRVNNSSNTTTPEGDRLAEGAAVLSLNDPYASSSAQRDPPGSPEQQTNPAHAVPDDENELQVADAGAPAANIQPANNRNQCLVCLTNFQFGEQWQNKVKTRCCRRVYHQHSPNKTCFEDTLRGQGARCLLCRDSTPVPFRVALITQPRQQQLQYRDVHELFPDALNAEPDELGPADLEDDRDSDSFDDSAIYGPEFEDHDDDSDYSSTPSGNYPDRSDCVLHSASNSEESNSSVEPESGSDNMGEGLFGAGQVSLR